MERLESINNIEGQEKYSSKIELSFFRHGEKEKDKTKSDFDIELTEAGKKQATLKSDTKNIEQSIAFGSPRARAQETAGFVMSGNKEEITGEETLEELKEKLDKGLLGSKIGVDKRLDFDLDVNSEFGKVAFDSFKNGEYLKFLVEKSDKVAEEVDDKEGSTYSRMASNIASIIDKYIKIAPVWDRLAQDKEKEYSDTLERFFGTHQGVNECFLAKIIEKTKGVEERDKFVEALDNKGFDFTEGFNVEILNKDSEKPIIHIKYKKEKDKEIVFEFDEDLSVDLLKEIVSN